LLGIKAAVCYVMKNETTDVFCFFLISTGHYLLCSVHIIIVDC